MTLQLTFPRAEIPALIRLRGKLRLAMNYLMAMAGGKVEPSTLEREFNELIASENANISRICFAYAESVDDLNDMRQDALINIWRGMKTFRDEASIRTWIYRVTINSCLSTIRRQKRHRHESLSQLYDLIDSGSDNRDEIEKMHKAISTLGREDRAIIMMWLDDMSYDDIASAVGMNRNTTATRIRRIKEKIKIIYNKEEQI